MKFTFNNTEDVSQSPTDLVPDGHSNRRGLTLTSNPSVLKQPTQFYSLKHILSKQCQYNMIIGERSNGKTYACLEYGLKRYIETGEEMAYIRRYREDFRGKRGDSLFMNHVSNGVIKKLTDGEYDGVKSYAGRWYLSKYDEELDKWVPAPDPFCYAFALSETEHDKSSSFPNITTVIFDEFLTRQYYLQDEFILFMNTLSTIIRHRDNVTIFMLGNTVNKYCPYFKEMGLGHVADMDLGKIDVYTYGKSKLKVAVERCAPLNKMGKKSDMYFVFDNPELQMITGGAWEIGLYPHLPMKYKRSNVCFTYFIEFNDNILQCEVVQVDNAAFTYIHEKTTPIQDEDIDLIFTTSFDPRPNHIRNLRRNSNPYVKKLASFFALEKVFYQNNEVGEIVRNYLQFCKTDFMYM